jgi:hypothetical protein
MRKPSAGWRANARRARSIWGQLPTAALEALRELTSRLAVSVAAGDLQFLENRWYVTHSGLLRISTAALLGNPDCSARATVRSGCRSMGLQSHGLQIPWLTWLWWLWRR